MYACKLRLLESVAQGDAGDSFSVGVRLGDASETQGSSEEPMLRPLNRSPSPDAVDPDSSATEVSIGCSEPG